MVGTEIDLYSAREVNIVHSGNMIAYANQTNAVYVSDMNKCGLNVLSIANDDSKSSIDGLETPQSPQKLTHKKAMFRKCTMQTVGCYRI